MNKYQQFYVEELRFALDDAEEQFGYIEREDAERLVKLAYERGLKDAESR